MCFRKPCAFHVIMFILVAVLQLFPVLGPGPLSYWFGLNSSLMSFVLSSHVYNLFPTTSLSYLSTTFTFDSFGYCSRFLIRCGIRFFLRFLTSKQKSSDIFIVLSSLSSFLTLAFVMVESLVF